MKLGYCILDTSKQWKGKKVSSRNKKSERNLIILTNLLLVSSYYLMPQYLSIACSKSDEIYIIKHMSLVTLLIVSLTRSIFV